MNIKFINYNGIKEYARVMYNDVKDADKYKIEVAYNGKDVKDLLEYLFKLESKIDKAIEYIEKDTRWFDSEYASIYGELCDCEGYNANRLEVMVNPSNLLKILKEDNYDKCS